MSMRVSPIESRNSGILFIGFNQDQSCFAVGMQNGFRVFNSDPLKQLERYEFDVHHGTGVGFVEMFLRSNLHVILGGGHHARLPSSVACLWDGIKRRFFLEITCPSDIKAVRLRRDRMVFVLMDAIKVYTLSLSPQLLYETSTCANPLGLCHVCQRPDNALMAVPGKRLGTVLLVDIGSPPGPMCNTSGTRFTTGASSIPPRQFVAHENGLAALEMNASGSLLATCSTKGTIIRVFTTTDCQLYQEFRRGLSPTIITSVMFSPTSDLLCVTSERGTAHIFSLKKGASQLDVRPRHSLPSSSSSKSGPEASDATNQNSTTTFHLNTSEVRCILDTKHRILCAFSPVNPNILVAIAGDGSYQKYRLSPNGSVSRVSFVNFLDFYDEDSNF